MTPTAILRALERGIMKQQAAVETPAKYRSSWVLLSEFRLHCRWLVQFDDLTFDLIPNSTSIRLLPNLKDLRGKPFFGRTTVRLLLQSQWEWWRLLCEPWALQHKNLQEP